MNDVFAVDQGRLRSPFHSRLAALETPAARITAGVTVSFTDTTSGVLPTTWAWDFDGDGTVELTNTIVTGPVAVSTEVGAQPTATEEVLHVDVDALATGTA